MSKRNSSSLIRHDRRVAKALYPGLVPSESKTLSYLNRTFGLTVSTGEILRIEGKWYVSHAGLIRLATRRHCRGINTILQKSQSDPNTNRWIFKAIVYKSRRSRGFVGWGDADPTNIAPVMRGAEMRIAETRAVNRALRKAYGIALCSVEELGWVSDSPKSAAVPIKSNGFYPPNGSNGNSGRLRDQLCLLIRQYSLDPSLVKAYAAHFCGTQTLKEASRDLVESFISHLSSSAREDRDGLICKLNSFSGPVEVKQ